MEIAKIIAKEHHERWDGNGYHGISGEDIDYYSRIISIVDVFDALLSKRSYKEAWDFNDACDEIKSQSGKQFDPTLVAVFVECLPEIENVSIELADT